MSKKEAAPIAVKQTRQEYLRYAYDLAKDFDMLPDDISDIPPMIQVANEDKILLDGGEIDIDPDLMIEYREALNKTISVPEYSQDKAAVGKLLSMPSPSHT